MMSTLKRLLDGLITVVYKLGLMLFFQTNKGKDFSQTYGVSFNPDITLSQLPIVIPSKNEFYRLSDTLNNFEIIHIDEEDLYVVIREICTDNEHKLSIDLFDLLFIKVEKPNLDPLIKEAKG